MVTNDIFLAMHNAMETAMQEQMNAPGWTYRDVPWASLSVWTDLLNLVGEDNIKIIVLTERGDSVRGQIMLSPAAMETIEKTNAKTKEAKAT